MFKAIIENFRIVMFERIRGVKAINDEVLVERNVEVLINGIVKVFAGEVIGQSKADGNGDNKV